MAGDRRQRLEALLASGLASVERDRARSLVVDTVVGVVRRERPVAVGILAASLAFRLFALYGSLGVALTLLVSLFLLARLSVATEELNAALWERRHPGGRPEGRAA
jgi:hypothetical protein